MKVEVDADELCQLKNKVNGNYQWDYHKLLYDSLKTKYDKLKEDLAKSPSPGVYEVVGGDIGRGDLLYIISEPNYKKLKKERGWWRERAFDISRLVDEREEIIMDSHCFYQQDGFDSHVGDLTKLAEDSGYEVPE